jgi:DNA-3-methyladenine glycosylase I
VTASRCSWCGDDPLYVAYHDEEWGVAVRDDRTLFELLTLEGAQAGLSWITILRKRDGYRSLFAGFDPVVVASFTPDDVERLLGDARIVRNRLKIESTIDNARAVLALHDAGESLSDVVWSHAPAHHVRPATPDDIPASTPEAAALSKALKRRGFRFVGPTTVYAFMQAAGVVDDHVAGCFRSRPSSASA